MRTIAMIVWILLLGLSQTAAAASNSADTQKKEDGKGLTVDDIGRGLKSAAQNIEKEIPKIGSAIGETVKKITAGDSEKQRRESRRKRNSSLPQRVRPPEGGTMTPVYAPPRGNRAQVLSSFQRRYTAMPSG